ncbi:MAG: hypothetical protein EXR59_02585 [Dehalococcoidia bacterium]|nr:hypothetical protein [Dehalococcoidia bacterium]
MLGLDAFVWWLAAQLLGFIAIPICYYIFRPLPDKGYAFSKAIGLLLVSFLVWVGATAHILPNAPISVAILAAALLLVSIELVIRSKGAIARELWAERKMLIASELVFSSFFALWAFAKVYDPVINHTEKPMDFTMLNGVLKSQFFPPHDPWLSGHSISYYYGGYLQASTLTKLTGMDPSKAFNLHLVLVFSMAAVGMFGLVANIIRLMTGRLIVAIVIGVLGCFFLFMPNLEVLLEFARVNNIGGQRLFDFAGVNNLSGPIDNAPHWYPNDFWWWWRASRVLTSIVNGGPQETITEFPFFSFMLGDLHPHVMSLPYTITAIGLTLTTLLRNELYHLAWIKRNWLLWIAILVIIGSLGFINSWDLPVYGMVFLSALLINNYWNSDRHLKIALLRTIPAALLTLVMFFSIFAPFYASIDTGSSLSHFIAPVRFVTTNPQHFFLFWGVMLISTIALVTLLVWRLGQSLRDWRLMLFVTVVSLIPYLIWALARILVGLHENEVAGDIFVEIGNKFWKLIPAHVILIAGAFVFIKGIAANDSKSDEHFKANTAIVFMLGLLLSAFLLITGAELFYVKDVFNTRLNTVFKFYYQAWTILTIVSAVAVYYLASAALKNRSSIRIRLGFSGYALLISVLFLLSLLYIPFSLHNKIGVFSHASGFDGIAYLQASEYDAIKWLRKEATSKDILIEAVGGSYSEYAKVSSSSGVPAVLGWPGHEFQWHGSAKLYAGREQDVAEMYQTTDNLRFTELIDKYNVTYIYVGDLERNKYGVIGLPKLDQLMDKPFSEGGSIIYKVRK